jgi:hypothetical protein
LGSDAYAIDDTDDGKEGAADGPAETSEAVSEVLRGGARPRKNKITRRLRRHSRGKTMKKHRNNKRRTNKVNTKRMVKRKKSKTTKIARRRDIVKK